MVYKMANELDALCVCFLVYTYHSKETQKSNDYASMQQALNAYRALPDKGCLVDAVVINNNNEVIRRIV